jgi:Mrp family chromosome partitioning ATPase
MHRLLGLYAESADATSDPANPEPVNVTRLPGVRVLQTPVGDNAPLEMFAHGLPKLIERARRAADIVIIDTAPIAEVSDGLRVAAVADQLIFVCRPRHTDRRRLAYARDLLMRSGNAPVGMVLVGHEVGLGKGDESYGYELALGARRRRPVDGGSGSQGRSRGSVTRESRLG